MMDTQPIRFYKYIFEIKRSFIRNCAFLYFTPHPVSLALHWSDRVFAGRAARIRKLG
jgi:hypothetical protein